MWKLFIDDERDPIANDWIIARSSAAAKQLCIIIGSCPNEIAFDHDLGADDTSMNFVKWFANAAMDGRITIPADFRFTIHSQNPVGADNIRCYMDAIVNNFKGG